MANYWLLAIAWSPVTVLGLGRELPAESLAVQLAGLSQRWVQEAAEAKLHPDCETAARKLFDTSCLQVVETIAFSAGSDARQVGQYMHAACKSPSMEGTPDLCAAMKDGLVALAADGGLKPGQKGGAAAMCKSIYKGPVVSAAEQAARAENATLSLAKAPLGLSLLETRRGITQQLSVVGWGRGAEPSPSRPSISLMASRSHATFLSLMGARDSAVSAVQEAINDSVDVSTDGAVLALESFAQSSAEAERVIEETQRAAPRAAAPARRLRARAAARRAAPPAAPASGGDDLLDALAGGAL